MRNFCFGHNLTAGQSARLMVYGYWYWHTGRCAYIVFVPHLDDLRVCRNHQIYLLMEMEGVDGQAIIMVFHKQGTRRTQVIQQNLQRQWDLYLCKSWRKKTAKWGWIITSVKVFFYSLLSIAFHMKEEDFPLIVDLSQIISTRMYSSWFKTTDWTVSDSHYES